MTTRLSAASGGTVAGEIQLNRRRFLKAATSIAAAFALLPLERASAGILTDASRLTASERKVFEKILKISLPVAGSSLVDPASLPVIATLEAALLAGMAPHIREGLRGGVGYFNDGAKAGFGKAFVDLSDADATRFMDAWSDGEQVPQRALAMGLKKLTVLAYWAIPNTWAPLGYDGPISERSGLKSLGNAPEPTA